MQAHILIIEDEADILELEEYHLQKAGFAVSGFLSTKMVKEFLDEEEVDLLIVDRNLPGAEGSEFIESLRAEGYLHPVIFVTAKTEDMDVQEGFLRGGDDYLKKPFNMNELILRVEALLRRTGKSETAKKVKYRDLLLDLTDRKLWIDGQEIKISRLEFALLYYFIQHSKRVLDRYELLENVWMDEAHTQLKTINVTINRLLKKIDPHREKEYIEAIRGVGYKLC